MTPLELPDVPRWVEAHGIAADPDGWRERAGDGVVFGHDVAKLLVVTGEADRDAVARMREGHPGYTCLFASEREDLAAAFAPSRAILHTLPDAQRLPDLDGAAALQRALPECRMTRTRA